MSEIKAVLFDFDGVIVDTEPLYDIYMNEVEKRYQLGIDDFANKIKGTPTPEVIKKYFSHLATNELVAFEKEMLDFELSMDFPPIAGSLAFIHRVKEEGYKIAIVTSSQDVKMKRALKILNLENVFDTVITADRITQGKPHPMCFELAAKDLGVDANNCLVFEDSLHGINAGNSAKMRVVGLTTSFSLDEIKDKVYASIDDFSDLNKCISLIKNKA